MWRIGSASVLQTDEEGSIPFIRTYDAYANWVGDCLQNSFGQFDSDKHLLNAFVAQLAVQLPLKQEVGRSWLPESTTLHSFNG